MRRALRTTVGVVLSLLLLGWALRGVSFVEVAGRIRAADPFLLSLSIIVALAGFHIRAYRWGFLLAPVSPGIAFRPRLAATYIGFAANNVLPARVGEFARAFSLSRLTGIGAASSLATLVVERLLDGLVLVALLFLAMASPGFPPTGSVAGIDLRSLALSAALVILVVGASLALAVLNRSAAGRLAHFSTRALPDRFRDPFRDILRSFATGLEVLRDPRLFLISIGLAVGQWLTLALSYVLAFRAFDILTVPFSGAVFLQSFISLAVAIPSSPGFFGPFEAASRVGLGIWGIPEGQAVSFAIGYHIAGFLPVTLIGVYYVWRLNISWSEVKASEETVEDEMHLTDPPAAMQEGK